MVGSPVLREGNQGWRVRCGAVRCGKSEQAGGRAYFGCHGRVDYLYQQQTQSCAVCSGGMSRGKPVDGTNSRWHSSRHNTLFGRLPCAGEGGGVELRYSPVSPAATWRQAITRRGGQRNRQRQRWMMGASGRRGEDSHSNRQDDRRRWENGHCSATAILLLVNCEMAGGMCFTQPSSELGSAQSVQSHIVLLRFQ